MRLALVSMPWAIFNRPSIQLGALQGFIRAHDTSIDVAAHHPYLEVAKEIGLDAYRAISKDSWAGEALYCSLLFPQRKEEARNVFLHSLGRRAAAALPDFDLLREKLAGQLDRWATQNDFTSTRLVGFSVCFGQLPATLLASRLLKKHYPALQIVLGGSSCVPETGYSLLRTFGDLDFVIVGEGELPLLALCRYLQGKTAEPGPGVLCRQDYTGAVPRRPSLGQSSEVTDLNSLPVPDYDDYFTELQQSGLGFIPQLPLEFSRGCWWNKCAFCNLNLQWCGYRSKKCGRLEKEVEEMRGKYRCLDFAFTDNALPPTEAVKFFTRLRNNNRDVRFFAEIRTTNKPGHYAVYRRGGLDSVQIGIEAFSNSLLKRMNKGVTVMDNLAAMKHCAEAGIRLDGNLILEFPGSTEEEVRETLLVLDFALPFHPLTGAGFFLGLGSPVWNDPAQYGIRAIRHHPYNRRLYPPSVLKTLSMLIMQGQGDRQQQRQIWRPVREKIHSWTAFHRARKSTVPSLSYREGGEFIIIRQEHPGKQTQHHRLTGISAQIYRACRNPVATKSLLHDHNSVTERALTVFLEDLEKKKLVFRDGDMVLALAVRQGAAGEY